MQDFEWNSYLWPRVQRHPFAALLCRMKTWLCVPQKIQRNTGKATHKFVDKSEVVIKVAIKKVLTGSTLVIALGFEPRTACLEGRCSIQLSYATLIA